MYRCADTVAACIRSLQQQTFSDYEALLVDDNSDDGTVAAATGAIDGDRRFRVLRQPENVGPSAARNRCLDEGTGHYLMFVDGDDWLEPQAMAMLVASAEDGNADVVCAGHIQRRERASAYHRGGIDKSRVLGHVDLLEYIRSYLRRPYEFTLLVHCWAKLYQFARVRASGVRFDRTMNQLEDVHFNFRYLAQCERVTFRSDCVYNHRIQYANNLTSRSGMEPDPVGTIAGATRAVAGYIAARHPERMSEFEPQISHFFCTTAMITMLRLARRARWGGDWTALLRMREIAGSDRLRSHLRHYRRGRGESALLFWALMSRVSWCAVVAAFIRVWALTWKGNK
jgi:hypothetical protein